MIGNGIEPSFIEQTTNNSIIWCDKISNNGTGIEIVHTRGKYLLALIKKFEVLSLPDTSYIPFTKNKTPQNVKKHDNQNDCNSKLLQTSATEDVSHQDSEASIEHLTMNTSSGDDCPDMKGYIEPMYIDKLSMTFKSDNPTEDLPEHAMPLDIDANPTLPTINSDDQNVRPNRLRIVTFDLSKTDNIYYDKDPESSDECDYLAFPEIADNLNAKINSSSTINETMVNDKELDKLVETNKMNNYIEASPENTDAIVEKFNSIADSSTTENEIIASSKNSVVIDGNELNILAETSNMNDDIETPPENTDVMAEELDILAGTNTINNEIEASHKNVDIIDVKKFNNLAKTSNIDNNIETPLEIIDIIDNILIETNNMDNDIIPSSENIELLCNEMKEINTQNNAEIIDTSTENEPFINIDEELNNHNDIHMDKDIDDDASIEDNMSIDINEQTLKNKKYLQLDDEELEAKHACVIHELIYQFNRLKYDKIHEVQVQTPPKVVHRIDSYDNSVYLMSKNNKADTRSINEKFIDILSIGKDEFYHNKTENVDIYVEVDGELHDYDSYAYIHNRSGFFSFISRLFLCGSK